MNRCLFIRGDYWFSLRGKNVLNEVVHVSGCYDIHKFDSSIRSPVFSAKTLFIEDCDKNFAYYFLSKPIFPEVKNIFLNSPCDRSVLYRFPKTTIFTPFKNWAKDDKDVIFLPGYFIRAIGQKLKPEKLI